MKILITGATGFFGQELGKALVRDGHEIFAISRDGEKAKLHLSYPATVIETDLMKAPPLAEKLAQIEAVVHLAGENIGETRWSNERKEKILRSRTQTSENLIKSLPESLKVFVGTSAVGFYGDGVS